MPDDPNKEDNEVKDKTRHKFWLVTVQGGGDGGGLQEIIILPPWAEHLTRAVHSHLIPMH